MGDVVGLVEKAQEVIDDKEAEKAARKMQKGQFNFEDFLKQLNMIRKLGSFKKILGMLPGMGQMLKDIDLDDRRFNRVEAMIQSMTNQERRNPAVITMERRRRIAGGSGNEVQAVHDLIKQFKMMQKMMAKMGRMGPGGMQDLLAGMGDPGAGGAGDAGGRPRRPRGPGGGGLRGFLHGKKR